MGTLQSLWCVNHHVLCYSWFLLKKSQNCRSYQKKFNIFLGLMKKIGRCIVVCFHPLRKNEIKYSCCFSSPVDAPSRNLNFQSDGLNLRRFYYFDFCMKKKTTEKLHSRSWCSNTRIVIPSWKRNQERSKFVIMFLKKRKKWNLATSPDQLGTDFSHSKMYRFETECWNENKTEKEKKNKDRSFIFFFSRPIETTT